MVLQQSRIQFHFLHQSLVRFKIVTFYCGGLVCAHYFFKYCEVQMG